MPVVAYSIINGDSILVFISGFELFCSPPAIIIPDRRMNSIDCRSAENVDDSVYNFGGGRPG